MMALVLLGVVIPAGSFTMGSPESEVDRDIDEARHEVTLTRAFWMGRTEVTQGLYQEIMGSNPSVDAGCGPDCPVNNLSWFKAVAFANALSAREELEPCYVIAGEAVSWPAGLDCEGYRLPTEAEWEYAARAGQPTLYAGSDDPDAVAWHSDNFHRRSRPVAGKQPNAWGLYDMSGNVQEWVWDGYQDAPTDPQVDPLGADDPIGRVLRGGSVTSFPDHVRVADRHLRAPGQITGAYGLRLARTQ